MRLYKNPTSPFARIAHVALIEAGVDDLDVRNVDLWSDPAELLAANSAGRVPCLVLDDGTAIAECLLIAAYAEQLRQAGDDGAGGWDPACLAVAGTALGVCDAAVQTMIGRRILSGGFQDTGFDEQDLGRKRRHAIIEGLRVVDTALVGRDLADLDLGQLVAIVALDYVDMRFPAADWIPPTPHLRGLRDRFADRPSLAATRPPA
ncbi:glutathione S-transferase family protein [Aurantimonas aggregata]|uniref:Glutathione S-transferase family protein n=1 Tax=Aurantimonas aggregata TaxID=2047720 RepID=A0A6L9MKS5_9HYPH|nr:glutathione S-transferase family protein [Aurantimonas aggregata]NDV88449.1 glutathione S-transferase family protein [Aurantimonas aggregata]